MQEDTLRALEIIECLQTEATIARRKLVQWSASADPDIIGLVYKSVRSLWSRFRPSPTRLDFGKLVGRSLEVSLRKEGRSSYALTDYEAAREFMAWVFQCYQDRERDASARRGLKWAVSHLAALYKAGSARHRRCLVDGAIEHLFEVDGIRIYFNGWQADRRLSRAYRAASAWASGSDAHGNHVSKLFLNQ